jgi:formate/nitrite transporter FocA (FNT family)
MASMPQPATLSPKQTTEACVESGVARHAQRVDVLFIKSIWGGIFLSYGGFLEAIIGGSLWETQNNVAFVSLFGSM